jgi:hypothetical protein
MGAVFSSEPESDAAARPPVAAAPPPSSTPVELARERLLQGTAIVTSAIAADTKGDFSSAFSLYQKALEVIVSALKGAKRALFRVVSALLDFVVRCFRPPGR